MSKYEVFQKQGGTWKKVANTSSVSTAKTGTATARFNYLTVDGVEKLLGIPIPTGETLPTVSPLNPPECRWFAKVKGDSEVATEGGCELYYFHPNYTPMSGDQYWMPVGKGSSILCCDTFVPGTKYTRDQVYDACMELIGGSSFLNNGTVFFKGVQFTSAESPEGDEDSSYNGFCDASLIGLNVGTITVFGGGSMITTTKSMLNWSAWGKFSTVDVYATYSGILGEDIKYINVEGVVHAIKPAVTKSDVGLGNVVNTGDSNTPAAGGTMKFTTGGAYTELAKKLNLSGGTMTGTLYLNPGAGSVKLESNDTYMLIAGGTSYENAAYLKLSGVSGPLNGGFELDARSSGGSTKKLEGGTDGTLKWCGTSIINPVPAQATFPTKNLTSGTILVTKIGKLAIVRFSGLVTSSTGTFEITDALPSGLKPYGSLSEFTSVLVTNYSQCAAVRIATSSGNHVFKIINSGGSAYTYYGEMVYATVGEGIDW